MERELREREKVAAGIIFVLVQILFSIICISQNEGEDEREREVIRVKRCLSPCHTKREMTKGAGEGEQERKKEIRSWKKGKNKRNLMKEERRKGALFINNNF